MGTCAIYIDGGYLDKVLQNEYPQTGVTPMFIRRTQTRGTDGGKSYFSYRLVRSERSGERVRQRTLLNLGSDFGVAPEHWPVLCARIEQLISPQAVLVELCCPEAVEREAQRIAMQRVSRAPAVEGGGGDVQAVDVDSLELVRPRSVGVEHVGLWAMEQAGLEELLEGLGFNGRQRAVPPPGLGLALGMDAGIATEKNIAWLRNHGYRYLVVSRQRARLFDPERATAIETRSHHKVHLHRVVDEDQGEVRLYCYSEARAKKEEGISKRFAARFEGALQKLHEGLSRPRTRKGLAHVWQRIGRIQEQSRGAAQHYQVDVVADPQSGKATAVTWESQPRPGTLLTHPGVYCLRTNLSDWDQQTLWRTYTMLTDLEAVFRSLKSELGLRPIFHRKQNRSDGHLFITVLAYQLVQIIRRRLAGFGETASWTTLRRILQGLHRVTATFRRKDGRTLHVRKATRAEPHQLTIYNVLGLNPAPGGIKKLTV